MNKSPKPPPGWKVTEARDVDAGVMVLVPDDESASAQIRRYEPGAIITADIRQPRNLQHHRKFWVLLEIVRENNDAFDSAETVLYALKAALGRGKWIEVPKASRPMFIPESISFASMDQEEFSRFYSDAVNAVLKHWLPTDRPALEEEIALRF